jgi:hypothetical protein
LGFATEHWGTFCGVFATLGSSRRLQLESDNACLALLMRASLPVVLRLKMSVSGLGCLKAVLMAGPDPAKVRSCVGRGADTGLKSATSRSFELAIDQFPSYPRPVGFTVLDARD